MVSLKKNILYNSIRVGSNLVFPLVTFPYVTRIMGPESLGLYNYVSAIVAYFTLFACEDKMVFLRTNITSFPLF